MVQRAIWTERSGQQVESGDWSTKIKRTLKKALVRPSRPFLAAVASQLKVKVGDLLAVLIAVTASG